MQEPLFSEVCTKRGPEFLFLRRNLMSKKEKIECLTNELMKFSNGAIYLNITQFSKAMGMSRKRACEILVKLKWKNNGNEKLFLALDIAEALCKD